MSTSKSTFKFESKVLLLALTLAVFCTWITYKPKQKTKSAPEAKDKKVWKLPETTNQPLYRRAWTSS